jgi:hypothetical protein
MNGLEQVQAMSKLAEQDNQAWQPSEIGGIKIGDAVRLPSIDCTFEVVAINDPLLTIKAPSGKEVRAGWRAVRRVRTRAEIREPAA